MIRTPWLAAQLERLLKKSEGRGRASPPCAILLDALWQLLAAYQGLQEAVVDPLPLAQPLPPLPHAWGQLASDLSLIRKLPQRREAVEHFEGVRDYLNELQHRYALLRDYLHDLETTDVTIAIQEREEARMQRDALVLALRQATATPTMPILGGTEEGGISWMDERYDPTQAEAVVRKAIALSASSHISVEQALQAMGQVITWRKPPSPCPCLWCRIGRWFQRRHST